MGKTFILGIGSQRAGSTFLSRLLNQHPEIAIHPLKELHYFDTIFGLRDEKVLKEFSKNQLNREVDKLCDAKMRKVEKIDFITPAWQCYMKTNLQLCTTPVGEIKYFDLFAEMNYENNTKFFGESTPEYMLFNKSQISKMKDVIGNAYIVMICRNPLKRMVSSFRLLLAYGRQNKYQDADQCDQLFMELIDKNDVWLKRQMSYGDYKQTIENYSTHFNKVLFLSYDDVVDKPENLLKNISQFFELNFESKVMLDSFKEKINPLSVKYVPGQEVLAKLDKLVERQNQEVLSLFGKPLVH